MNNKRFHIYLGIRILVNPIGDQPAGFFNIPSQSAVDDRDQRSFPGRIHFVSKTVIKR